MIATGQGLLGNNMFAYCGNNSLTRRDSSGASWEDFWGWVSDGWNAFVDWCGNTFGASASVTTTISESSVEIIPSPSPIVVETGTTLTHSIVHGDSSKLISVYADGSSTDPVGSSSAGILINISDFSLDISLGLDDTSIYCVINDGNKSDKFGAKMDLTELKVGFESVSSYTESDYTHSTYTNASINGGFIIAALLLLYTGQIYSPNMVPAIS